MNVCDAKIIGLASLAALFAWGGGGPGQPGGGSGSKVEATITGKVTVAGAAVSKGKVTVSPPGPPFVEKVAAIKPDGTCQVKTYAGENAISVAGTGNPAAGDAYNKANYDVKEGANTIDLALPLKDQ